MKRHLCGIRCMRPTYLFSSQIGTKQISFRALMMICGRMSPTPRGIVMAPSAEERDFRIVIPGIWFASMASFAPSGPTGPSRRLLGTKIGDTDWGALLMARVCKLSCGHSIWSNSKQSLAAILLKRRDISSHRYKRLSWVTCSRIAGAKIEMTLECLPTCWTRLP